MTPRSAVAISGPVIGPVLADRVDYVMFTGSVRTGRIVGSQAAGRLIGCSLELGGKNPVIVSRHADLDKAATGIVRSAFGLQGQKCSAASRVLIEEPVYDQLVDKLVTMTNKLTIHAVDPKSGTAEFKASAINVELARTDDTASH
mgnify:CR=1 FL=1